MAEQGHHFVQRSNCELALKSEAASVGAKFIRKTHPSRERWIEPYGAECPRLDQALFVLGAPFTVTVSAAQPC
jgi:hypothetical protein